MVIACEKLEGKRAWVFLMTTGSLIQLQQNEGAWEMTNKKGTWRGLQGQDGGGL